MAAWAFVNDAFYTEEEAVLPIRDLALQRGYGIFDFFKLAGNTPLYPDLHLDRFYASAAQMNLPITQDRNELMTLVQQLVQKNNLPGSGVRLTLTGGLSPDGYSIASPSLVLSQHTFQPPAAEQLTNGIKLMSYPHQRQLPTLKTIDYIMAIWLQPLLKQRRCDDVLYHKNGFISETPRANVFVVNREGRIITPEENILKGITRHVVLELARDQFEVESRAVSLSELYSATEVFITSTTKLILPVASVDEYPVGDPAFPVATLLRKLLKTHQQEAAAAR